MNAGWQYKASLIKMYSDVGSIQKVDVESIQKVLLMHADTVVRYPSFPWYARVPSSSNCSDRVSRMLMPEDANARRITVKVEQYLREDKRSRKR